MVADSLLLLLGLSFWNVDISALELDRGTKFWYSIQDTIKLVCAKFGMKMFAHRQGTAS